MLARLTSAAPCDAPRLTHAPRGSQACREQLRQSILLWLQSEALEAGGEEESSGEDELQDALEEARDAPANEHLKQQANKGVALMLQMLSACTALARGGVTHSTS